MGKPERFTDQAFTKVTDKKAIEEAKLRAEALKAELTPKVEDNEIL